jgi:hypothetical protein
MAPAAGRIDIAAIAIFHDMTADAVSDLDLSYTPPLGSPWETVQMGTQACVRDTQPHYPPEFTQRNRHDRPQQKTRLSASPRAAPGHLGRRCRGHRPRPQRVRLGWRHSREQPDADPG